MTDCSPAKEGAALLSSLVSSPARDATKMSIAEAALHEKRERKAKCVDVYWIPPTSDDVERLFTLAGRIFSDHRRAMLPDTLELIVYLRFNRKLWGLSRRRAATEIIVEKAQALAQSRWHGCVVNEICNCGITM
jgi:hypothetical protein